MKPPTTPQGSHSVPADPHPVRLEGTRSGENTAPTFQPSSGLETLISSCAENVVSRLPNCSVRFDPAAAGTRITVPIFRAAEPGEFLTNNCYTDRILSKFRDQLLNVVADDTLRKVPQWFSVCA